MNQPKITEEKSMAIANTIHVRWMIRRDSSEVLEIEKLSNRNFLTEDELLALLRQSDVIGIVAEIHELVVGHVIYRLTKRSVEILAFAVDPDFRRCGVGTALINRCKSRLNAKRDFLLIHAPDDNLGMHLFLKHCGMTATHVARNYFGHSDGYRFVFESTVSSS